MCGCKDDTLKQMDSKVTETPTVIRVKQDKHLEIRNKIFNGDLTLDAPDGEHGSMSIHNCVIKGNFTMSAGF
jgi:hypothetical protein